MLSQATSKMTDECLATGPMHEPLPDKNNSVAGTFHLKSSNINEADKTLITLVLHHELPEELFQEGRQKPRSVRPGNICHNTAGEICRRISVPSECSYTELSSARPRAKLRKTAILSKPDVETGCRSS